MATAMNRGLVIPAGTPPGIKELVERIDHKDGVLTMTMASLRNAYGRERLGKNILHDIAATLRRLGIEHQPRQLPPNQEVLVRLYRADSEVGRLIKAALTPGSSRDVMLRSAAASKTVAALKQVSELVDLLRESVADALD